MSEINPYQAPEADEPIIAHAEVVAPQGVWRDGKLLVMTIGATLPRRCIKSNREASDPPVQRRLSWHHPAIILSILIGLPIYIVLAIVLSKRATIVYSLSDQWKAIRRRRIAVSWLGGLTGLGIFVAGCFLTGANDDWAMLLIALGIMSMLFSAIIGLSLARLISPKKITDTHVWLRGVHPDYLASLPVAPGGRV